MIPRYEAPEISALWSDEAKFKSFLKTELAVMKAFEGTIIPTGLSDKIAQKVVIKPHRIDEIEKQVHHDIIAFCSSITEQLTDEEGKFFHFGVTSSDIIDTATNLQIRDSLKIILDSLQVLRKTLYQKCLDWKNIITIGRSHGMYAEPLSFGQKFLGFYCEFSRRFEDLESFYQNDLTAQFSGAVGNYAVITPTIEKKAAQLLNLNVEPVSTQVIPRDRIAKLISITSLLADAIERVAVEIRHLHRSEVGEIAEGFAKGQKGSSTMPHKKNPISGENLTGLARVLRSHLLIAHENTILWHERDISHSSAERLYLPDHFGLLQYALQRLTKTLNNLQIDQEKIEDRVRSTNSYLSSFYLHLLIEKTKLTREQLYEKVQEAAFSGLKANNSEVFYSNLIEKVKELGLKSSDLPKPTFEEIKKIYLKYTDEVFNRTALTYNKSLPKD